MPLFTGYLFDEDQDQESEYWKDESTLKVRYKTNGK